MQNLMSQRFTRFGLLSLNLHHNRNYDAYVYTHTWSQVAEEAIHVHSQATQFTITICLVHLLSFSEEKS